jgi:hypothetical protein
LDWKCVCWVNAERWWLRWCWLLDGLLGDERFTPEWWTVQQDKGEKVKDWTSIKLDSKWTSTFPTFPISIYKQRQGNVTNDTVCVVPSYSYFALMQYFKERLTAVLQVRHSYTSFLTLVSNALSWCVSNGKVMQNKGYQATPLFSSIKKLCGYDVSTPKSDCYFTWIKLLN